MVSYVLSVRNSVSGGTFGNAIGQASYLIIPDADNTPAPAHDTRDVTQWFEKIRAEALPVVFFIHGYNTTTERALNLQRVIERSLREHNFKCTVVGFDWPSNGRVTDYLSDRKDAFTAAWELVDVGLIPFIHFSRKACSLSVNILAHSMGAFIVREAFRKTDKLRLNSLVNNWRVGQVVFFAADISARCFTQDNIEMFSVFHHCGRLTNYYSGYDEALAVSGLKNVDFSSRVGRIGIPAGYPVPEKVVDVDCGPRYQSVPDRHLNRIQGNVSHSWYLEDDLWYEDLALTLCGKSDRSCISTRRKANGMNKFILNERNHRKSVTGSGR
jgi:Uncharacterized protein conserved in bacteria